MLITFVKNHYCFKVKQGSFLGDVQDALILAMVSIQAVYIEKMVSKPGRQVQTLNIGLSAIKNVFWKEEGAKKILYGNREHCLTMVHAVVF